MGGERSIFRKSQCFFSYSSSSFNRPSVSLSPSFLALVRLSLVTYWMGRARTPSMASFLRAESCGRAQEKRAKQWLIVSRRKEKKESEREKKRKQGRSQLRQRFFFFSTSSFLFLLLFRLMKKIAVRFPLFSSFFVTEYKAWKKSR